MGKQRIEYIDALRGFCMYLVVYAHICGYGYHMDNAHSFHHILVNFYLVLFFFVSGFVAYKKDVQWTGSTLGTLLRKKFVQLIIPSVVFCFLFCIYDHHSYNPLWHVSTIWYWFTVQLFLFFLFYYLTMMCSRRMSSTKQDLCLIAVAIILYLLSHSHVLFERTTLGATLFSSLGMEKWRLYIFFCVGVLMRKHIEVVKRWINNPIAMAAFVILFFMMVFFADRVTHRLLEIIKSFIYGSVSIMVIFAFFYKYQHSFSQERALGRTMQYVGKRTLDIYMIHYFVLPFHLDMLGQWFTNNPNPAIEFFITTAIALMVIAISIVIGNIIRLSPTLSHYLLGTK